MELCEWHPFTRVPKVLTHQAYEGNVLEAVNLALNPFDEHYIDRDLSRTGLSMTIVTPGTGHFAVDKKLLRLTSERMVDHGIGLDLVCLTKMPLHSVPLFSYISKKPKSGYKAVGGDGVVGTPDLLYFDADWVKASDVELADCYCTSNATKDLKRTDLYRSDPEMGQRLVLLQSS